MKVFLKPSVLEEFTAFFVNAGRHTHTPEYLNFQRHGVIHRNICQTFMVASFNKPEYNAVFLTFRIVQLDFVCLSLRKLRGVVET
jgi:hypothetical protein